MNAFLGAYLARMRRGGTVLVEAPRYTFVGDVLDLDVRIAQVVALRLAQVEVRVVCGPSTDELVRPLALRALGARHAAGLLTAPAR